MAGEKDTVLISDIFYSDNYNIKLIPSANIKEDFNSKNGTLTLKPGDHFEGLGLIDFKLNDSLYAIPYFLRSCQKSYI